MPVVTQDNLAPDRSSRRANVDDDRIGDSCSRGNRALDQVAPGGVNTTIATSSGAMSVSAMSRTKS
jgi:hypothetical protein